MSVGSLISRFILGPIFSSVVLLVLCGLSLRFEPARNFLILSLVLMFLGILSIYLTFAYISALRENGIAPKNESVASVSEEIDEQLKNWKSSKARNFMPLANATTIILFIISIYQGWWFILVLSVLLFIIRTLYFNAVGIEIKSRGYLDV